MLINMQYVSAVCIWFWQCCHFPNSMACGAVQCACMLPTAVEAAGDACVSAGLLCRPADVNLPGSFECRPVL